MSIDFSGGAGASMGSWGGGDWSGKYQQSLAAGQNKGGAGYRSLTDMLQGNQTQVHGGQQGGSAWGQAPQQGGGGGGLTDLLNKQLSLGDQADQKNEANWNQGKGLLLGSQNDYNNSSITQGNRNLVSGLQANPYTINGQVQANIQGQAAAGINASNAAAARDIGGSLAAGGQADASSMAALRERQGRSGQAQLSQTMSNLDVQKAFQDKQDVQNAAHLGQQQAAQDYGVNAGTANSFLQNMPQYRAPNLAGFAAALPKQFGGAAGGGAQQQGGAGWGQQPQQSSMFGGSVLKHAQGSTQAGFNWGGPGIANNDPKNMGYNRQQGTPGPQYNGAGSSAIGAWAGNGGGASGNF